MIICKLDKGIGLRSRNPDTLEIEEREVSFNEFRPYFFVRKNDRNLSNEYFVIKDKWGNCRITITSEEGDYRNLDGEELVKVSWTPNHPRYGYKLRDMFEESYEADVQMHYRYAIDEIEEIVEYKMRKWYWDMEWMQGGEHDGAITCISMYDNYDEEYTTYAWYPDDTYKQISSENTPEATLFSSEKKMLVAFLSDVIDKDPDMLISWFGWKFDLPKLIERMVWNVIDPRLLSPFNELTGVSWRNGSPTYSPNIYEYSPVNQPIKGRICVPLDMAFERQWNDSQRGTLPSMALDYVAEMVLGEKKLTSEKFPDKNEFFARGWLEDAETYLEYARIDVELLVRIDEMQHTTEAILSLQRLLRAPFDACFYASNMGGIYFMRNASWKAPTGRKGERASYDGAMVYDPLSEGTNGLHLGVAAFDFAGLYPSMAVARNISWETKSEEPTEFAVNVKTPKDFSDVTQEKMRYFKTDELGLLPKAVLELKQLRNEYKKRMKEATSESEYTKWNNNQLAVKRLSASFYGIVAYQGFGWADVELAECITASAREAIRSAAFKAREL